MDKNKYLETVAEQIRCKRAVPFLKQELKDHIEDQMEAYIADGMNPEEAEEAAVREMGNPVETGVELDRVHRPKMDRKVLLGAIFLGVLGIIIQAMILSTVYKEQMGPEYSAPYHIYALDEIMEQAAITLGGIVTMLAVCYLDYSRLFKHTRKIWIGLNVLLILICVFDFPILSVGINGVNRFVALIAYLAIPLYGALIYSYKNQGMKGFVKSLSSLLVFLWVMTFEVPLGFIAMVGIILGLVLARALHINWFKMGKEGEKQRAKTIIRVWIGVVIALVVTFCVDSGYSRFVTVPDYYARRLQAFLTGNSQDIVAEMIKAFLKKGEYVSELTFLKLSMQSDYVWLVVVEKIGGMAAILLAVGCGVLAVLLLRRAYREKNRLGHFIALSCVWFLIIETIFNIGGNLGVTPFMGSFMPFLANGKTVAGVSYFYMGVLMSVFRNTNVVRN